MARTKTPRWLDPSWQTSHQLGRTGRALLRRHRDLLATERSVRTAASRDGGNPEGFTPETRQLRDKWLDELRDMREFCQAFAAPLCWRRRLTANQLGMLQIGMWYSTAAERAYALAA